MITTLRIDRLSLDLRGIDPATAEAAVRLLGPALQAQMAQMAQLTDPEQSGSNGQASSRPATQRLQSNGAARDHIDAGRIAAVTQPQALAQRLAQRLAERVAHSLVPPVRKG